MAEGRQQGQMHVCMYVGEYNKTQIQMAFYATCFGMPGRRAGGGSRRPGAKPSQHVSHVFHYVRQTG